MTRNLNDLHPTPYAEALTTMEMQPERFDLVAWTAHFPRATAEDTEQAVARAVFTFGKDITREELAAFALDAIAALHAFIETRHTLRLDYVPGADGTADVALDEYAPEEGPNTDE